VGHLILCYKEFFESIIRYTYMTFQVLTAASVNTAEFWDIAPCTLVTVDRRFRSAYCLHHQGRDDGGKNVGLLQRDYTALYYRRLSTSDTCKSRSSQSESRYYLQMACHNF
jgi:hypothetical protein